MEFFRDQLNLAELFGGSWQDFNINYESSSLIYRICFSAWDGMQIKHDPLYEGYILSTENAESQSTSPGLTPEAGEFPTTIVVGAVIAVAIVILSLLLYFKKRKH
jgi:hypothetical protein